MYIYISRDQDSDFLRNCTEAWRTQMMIMYDLFFCFHFGTSIINTNTIQPKNVNDRYTVSITVYKTLIIPRLLEGEKKICNTRPKCIKKCWPQASNNIYDWNFLVILYTTYRNSLAYWLIASITHYQKKGKVEEKSLIGRTCK